MERNNRRHSGFTIIEVVVAMLLIVATAAGILLPMTSAMGVEYEAIRQTLAAKLTSDRLEQIVAAGCADAFVGTESPGAVRKADGTAFADPVYAKFSRTVSAQPAVVGALEMQWVTVVVSHEGQPVCRMSTLIEN